MLVRKMLITQCVNIRVVRACKILHVRSVRSYSLNQHPQGHATTVQASSVCVTQNGRVTANFVFVISYNYLGVQRREIHDTAPPVHSYIVVRDDPAVVVHGGAGE